VEQRGSGLYQNTRHPGGSLLNLSSTLLPKARIAKPVAKDSSTFRVTKRTLGGLAQIFKLLSDESRLKIVLALAQDGELHVTAICELLNQKQAAVSHHLALLRMCGLLGYRRVGKRNYYHLEQGLVSSLLDQFFEDTGNGHRQIQFDDFSLAFKRK
jgi:ArsR family transcriptional regulator